jgi:transcriptional regulator with XRE-family HTH domain
MKGKELRKIRGSLKMTQRQLAEALDVAKDTVARMERDEMPIQQVTEFAVRYLLLMEKREGRRR